MQLLLRSRESLVGRRFNFFLFHIKPAELFSNYIHHSQFIFVHVQCTYFSYPRTERGFFLSERAQRKYLSPYTHFVELQNGTLVAFKVHDFYPECSAVYETSTKLNGKSKLSFYAVRMIVLFAFNISSQCFSRVCSGLTN